MTEYSAYVTLLARRRIHWSLFITACLCLALSIPLFFLLPKAGPNPGFLQTTGSLKLFSLGKLEVPSHYFIGAGIVLCCLYSALSLGLILSSFRKTDSTEVFFFSFWVLSAGLEVLRLGAFALAAEGGTTFMHTSVSRALLFARYAGCLALFISGLYAVGFRNEKLGSVLAVLLGVSFGLSLAMPINTGSYAETLELRSGYAGLNSLLFIIVGIVTTFNYLYAAVYKGERTYRLVGLGAAAFIIGHRLMVSCWNPLLLLLGFVLLVTGTWLFVSRLHAYYLWQ